MKYRCLMCGYIYDDDKEQVPFNELPDDWVCPLCGSPKSLFEKIVEEESPSNVEENETSVSSFDDTDEDLTEFTPNELAMLMANLARGSEKQYKQEEQELFLKLKDYFESIKSTVDEAKVSSLIKEIDRDLEERYVTAMNLAKDDKDRGAQRALTWTTKSATILKTLLETYQKEGDKMLDGKHVYVCTICGFIYIGDKVPEICPICKVPSFKFEEVI